MTRLKYLLAATTLTLSSVGMPVAVSAGPTATPTMSGTAQSVCMLNGTSGLTSVQWPLAIRIRGGGSNITVTFNGGNSATATVYCNNPATKLRISAPSADCGSGVIYNYKVNATLTAGGSAVASVNAPATGAIIVNPPLLSTNYTIAVVQNGSGPGNVDCTGTVTLSLS